jgi:hypothetical protein
MPNFFWDETTEDHLLDARKRLERHIRERLAAVREHEEDDDENS